MNPWFLVAYLLAGVAALAGIGWYIRDDDSDTIDDGVLLVTAAFFVLVWPAALLVILMPDSWRSRARR